MNKQENLDSHLFKDLRALSESSFPKKCSSCGKVYESSEQFVLKTADIGGRSGLKSSEDDCGDQIVELFRNCICGSTLMECFNDRRDLSTTGLKRRELFGRLMAMLEKKGLPADQARAELLKLIRGKHSRVLQEMGVNFK
jgi:predicted  nucleic acid-binding Zn-ribbon protein